MSTSHENRHFVVQCGKAVCDKGSKLPNFKVTSHEKHYWNNKEGQSDYLAVTEDDITFNPPAMPFGSCSAKNGNPCAFAAAGKWTKTYEKVKVMEKKCITEISELLCTTGGKITILNHGQKAQMGKSSVKNADPKTVRHANPLVDFEEFRDEIVGNESEAW